MREHSLYCSVSLPDWDMRKRNIPFIIQLKIKLPYLLPPVPSGHPVITPQSSPLPVIRFPYTVRPVQGIFFSSRGSRDGCP